VPRTAMNAAKMGLSMGVCMALPVRSVDNRQHITALPAVHRRRRFR